MSMLYLLYVVIIETVEVFWLAKEFLGLDMKTGRKRALFYPVLLLLAAVCYLVELPGFFFSLAWVFAVIYMLFFGGFWRKFQFAWIIYLVITHVDVFIWSLAIIAIPSASLPAGEVYDVLCSVAGIGVWLVLILLARLKKWKIAAFFQSWSGKQFTLLIIGLGIMGIFVGSMQGFLYDEMTKMREKASLVLCILTVLFVVIVYCVLAQNVLKRKNLEEVVRLDRQYMDLQKKYYDDSLRKYEELRAFRHDIRRHIQLISHLYCEKRFDELGDYIRRLDRDYEAVAVIATGNSITDCLLNDMLERFAPEEKPELSFVGKVPPSLPMESVDACILFSNAFDNAEEALKKLSGKRCFNMEIGQTKDELCIKISNSVGKEQINIEETSKKDKGKHGYGIAGMRKVVAKYQGEILWEQTDGMMSVNIFLPFKGENEG